MNVWKGTPVCLLLPNCPQAIIAQFGIWKVGTILAPLNPLYAESELHTAFQKSDAEIAVVLAPFYEWVKAAQANTQWRQVISVNIKTYLPPLLCFLFTLLKEKNEDYHPKLRKVDQAFEDFLARNANLPLSEETVAPNDLAILIFSGGTTGIPKAARGLHKHLIMAGMQFKAWFGSAKWKRSLPVTRP